jgi:DNA-binding SARP family transcriptional activator
LIEFRILGPLEVVRDGRSIPLGRQRQRGVLALLVLRSGEVVPSGRLIDELWGDEASESALNALQATVSRLRRLLGAGELLVTQSPGYALRLAPDQQRPLALPAPGRRGRAAALAG